MGRRKKIDTINEPTILEQIEKSPTIKLKTKKVSSKIKKSIDKELTEKIPTPKIEELKISNYPTYLPKQKLTLPTIKPKFDITETSVVPKTKQNILDYLYTKFSDVGNNYSIVKMMSSTRVEFRLITDICLVSEKINIEFPNSYWHNFDIEKITRDSILENEGWKVLNIDSTIPTVDDVIKSLQENNLI
jgi:hypothetical protein